MFLKNSKLRSLITILTIFGVIFSSCSSNQEEQPVDCADESGDLCSSDSFQPGSSVFGLGGVAGIAGGVAIIGALVVGNNSHDSNSDKPKSTPPESTPPVTAENLVSALSQNSKTQCENFDGLYLVQFIREGGIKAASEIVVKSCAVNTDIHNISGQVIKVQGRIADNGTILLDSAKIEQDSNIPITGTATIFENGVVNGNYELGGSQGQFTGFRIVDSQLAKTRFDGTYLLKFVDGSLIVGSGDAKIDKGIIQATIFSNLNEKFDVTGRVLLDGRLVLSTQVGSLGTGVVATGAISAQNNIAGRYFISLGNGQGIIEGVPQKLDNVADIGLKIGNVTDSNSKASLVASSSDGGGIVVMKGNSNTDISQLILKTTDSSVGLIEVSADQKMKSLKVGDYLYNFVNYSNNSVTVILSQNGSNLMSKLISLKSPSNSITSRFIAQNEDVISVLKTASILLQNNSCALGSNGMVNSGTFSLIAYGCNSLFVGSLANSTTATIQSSASISSLSDGSLKSISTILPFSSAQTVTIESTLVTSITPVTNTTNSSSNSVPPTTIPNNVFSSLSSNDSTTSTTSTTTSTTTTSTTITTTTTTTTTTSTTTTTVLTSTDTTAPTLSSASLSSNNSYVDVTFSEGVYNSSLSTLSASNFTLIFTQNSGGATAASISSLTTTSNGTLSAGDSSIRFNLSLTGTPTGVETISISPKTSNVYDSSSNAMLSTQSTGTLTLNDQTAPVITFFTVNSSTTSSSSITLSIAGIDAIGITGYYLSETSIAPSSSLAGWTSIPRSTSYLDSGAPFSLSSASGIKSIYLFFKDAAGNVSSSSTVSITKLQQMGESIQGNSLSLTTAVTIFAGSGTNGNTDGQGTSASFGSTSSIATDGTNLFVTESNNKIRKILISNWVVTTFAGSGNYGSTDGTGTEASFWSPNGITSDGTNLYVADSGVWKVRKIVISSGVVTTLAGSGSYGSINGTGTSASFGYLRGITTDGTNLYVVDNSFHKIRKIVISSGVVTTLVGSGTSGADNGTGIAASFYSPDGITTDGTNLYVADAENRLIRKVEISSSVVSTLAGSGSYGSDDGTGIAASFGRPKGITTDGTNLYVTDNFFQKIRKIVISSGVVTTLAGTGSTGSADGTGTAASFTYPYGITTDGTYLYVNDSGNYLIRKIQ